MKMILSRIGFLSFVILSLVFAVGAQATGQPATQSQAKLITDFEVNGLKVIVKRRPGAPTVSAGLFVRGGVRNLTPETAGLENLTLSVATEASKKFPRDAMRRELSRMASGLGAGSNEDFSVVSLTSTRANFDRTWEIFTDAAVNPAFASEDFELVRGRVMTALRNQSISPDSALDVMQKKVIYAGHPYAVDPNGTLETIGGLKVEDLDIIEINEAGLENRRRPRHGGSSPSPSAVRPSSLPSPAARRTRTPRRTPRR